MPPKKETMKPSADTTDSEPNISERKNDHELRSKPEQNQNKTSYLNKKNEPWSKASCSMCE